MSHYAAECYKFSEGPVVRFYTDVLVEDDLIIDHEGRDYLNRARAEADAILDLLDLAKEALCVGERKFEVVVRDWQGHSTRKSLTVSCVLGS